jgi:hypothetical protein
MMGGGGHMGGNHANISAGRGRSVAHNGNFRGGRWNGVGYGYGDCFGLTPYLYQQCIAGYY